MTVPLSKREQQQFIADYTNPNKDLKYLSEQVYGRPIGTLWRWAYELGISRPKATKAIGVTVEELQHAMMEAALNIPALEPAQREPIVAGRGEPMELILELSDEHVGRLTKSYNTDVFLQRIGIVAEEVIAATKLLRQQYVIRALNIASLGDIVLGEQIGRQVSLEELQRTIMPQVYDLAIPALTALTLRLAQHFEDVFVFGVRGNHGGMGRYVSKGANWDSIVHLGWKSELKAQENIHFDIERDEWYQIVNIMGHSFLLTHGDQIPVKGGAVYNSVIARCTKWQSALRQFFDYVLMGHFHSYQTLEASRLRVYVNPTFVSDDSWAQGVLGLEGKCAQRLLGVTRKGVVWEREILLH